MSAGARATLDADMSERDWQTQVVKLAELEGWLYFHDPNIQKCRHCGHVQPDGREPGFPDLVMLRGVQAIVLELKTEDGTVTDAQQIWIDGFDKVKRVEAAVARPSNWPDVERALKRRAR